jgi:dihydrodipicolinate synthase/N-acetylneuraminate lyase
MRLRPCGKEHAGLVERRMRQHRRGLVLGDTGLAQGFVRQVEPADFGIFVEVAQDVGELQRAAEMMRELASGLPVPLYEIRNRRPGYKCSMIKTAMNMCGLNGGYVRAPLIELNAGDRADLEGLLSRIGLLAGAEVGA